MGEHALEVDSVVVSYGGGAPVLKGVSLGVAPGEFIALLGSSGCGKTTLLRAISGFVPIQSGSVKLAGNDITNLPPDKREMAMVFQSYALWPHMTTTQNIAYGLRLRRMPAEAVSKRVDEMISMLGLEGLGDRKVTQLSGGQRQRVALGRALAVNLPVLLLDEPLSNLDARIRQVMRHEIKAIQDRLGITAIHVTHDREEAMVMADRIVILDDGEIVQVGAPVDVYNRPVSPFVASFMGADNVVPINVQREEKAVIIAQGPNNDAATLPISAESGDGGTHLANGVDGEVNAHFRSEAAQLVVDDDTPMASLVLRGNIVQTSYPGGFYRYAVDVGERRFMVDDQRQFSVGVSAGIRLPADTLHLYPAG